LNESIKEELMEKIQAGDNFISDQVVKKDGVNFNETSEIANVKMFDEKTMKLDPNQRVKGESKTYSWEETPRTIDIEVPVPLGTKKSDLTVRIEADYIAVSCLQKTILEGPLQGKINPSQSMWDIAGDDIYATFRGERLIISLEKSFSSQEIWASVLNRDYLASQKNMIFKSD
jgi:HSP20 family molecular chaperone IbpA